MLLGKIMFCCLSGCKCTGIGKEDITKLSNFTTEYFALMLLIYVVSGLNFYSMLGHSKRYFKVVVNPLDKGWPNYGPRGKYLGLSVT